MKLLQYIEKYYPKNISTADDRYFDSKEFNNLQKVREQAKINNASWLDAKADFERKLPEYLFEDWSYLMNDASYIGRFYFPGTKEDSLFVRSMVICVSVIAPVFLIYYSEQKKEGNRFLRHGISYQPSDFYTPMWNNLSEIIKKYFDGYSLIDPSDVFRKIENVSVGNKPVGEATFGDCLFTDNIW
jgi:hypothetical protein